MLPQHVQSLLQRQIVIEKKPLLHHNVGWLYFTVTYKGLWKVNVHGWGSSLIIISCYMGMCVGVLTMILSMIMAMGWMLNALYCTIYANHPSWWVNWTLTQYSTPPVQPSHMPQFIYYFVAFLLSGVFHEAGHAIAAWVHGVSLQAMGWVILGGVPGAFVDMNTHDYMALSPYHRLTIVCGGVWHNTVMALVGYSVGRLLSLWNTLGLHGLMLLDVAPSSPLMSHVTVPSRVLSVDHHVVQTSLKDWYHLLHVTVPQTPPRGYCMSHTHLLTSDCCHTVTQELPLGHSELQCWVYDSQQFVCNSVEETVLHSVGCTTSKDCEPGVCLFPYIPSKELRMMELVLHQIPDWNQLHDEWHKVVFIGTPQQLYTTGKLQVYDSCQCNILIPMSLMLGLFNSLPVYDFDGIFILKTLLDILLSNRVLVDKRRIKRMLVYSVRCIMSVALWIMAFTLVYPHISAD